MKTILAAAALAALPGLAAAMGCNYDRAEQVTQSCAPGTTWDADQAQCVATPTG